MLSVYLNFPINNQRYISPYIIYDYGYVCMTYKTYIVFSLFQVVDRLKNFSHIARPCFFFIKSRTGMGK